MQHVWRTLLSLLVALPLTTTALAAPAGAEPADAPTLSTTGVGEVEAVADVAEIHLAVSTRAPTAQRAGADNAARSRKVRAALVKAGVPGAAIATRNYRLQQAWRHQDREQVPDGYEAYHQLIVRDRDPETVGRLIDAALAAGANRVEAVQFTVSDAQALRHKALRQAVNRARAEAEIMACAAGGGLGPLQTLRAAPAGNDRPVYAMRAEAFADATPIAPDTVTVRAEAQAEWTFVPTDAPSPACEPQ